MLPSAEEASDTQFAEGAVVTFQVCAPDHSVGSKKQMLAAIIRKMRAAATAAWIASSGQGLRNVHRAKVVEAGSHAFTRVSSSHPAPRRRVTPRLVSHLRATANLVCPFIAITPARGFAESATGIVPV